MSPHEDRRSLWRQRLAEQRASGESVTSWCFRHDISLPTFYYWRRQLPDAPAPTPDVPAGWLALAPQTPTAATLTLRVGQVVIEVSAGFDPHLLGAVLTVLEAR